MSAEGSQIISALKMYDFMEQYINKNTISSIQDLLKLAVHQSFPKGQNISSIGDDCTNLGFLLKGAIRSYYIDANGNDFTKHFYIDNQFFWDEALVGYEKSICFYEALEDCEILSINTKLLREILINDSELSKLYIACLENGIRYKIARENAFLTKSATDRYIEFKKNYPLLEGRIKQSYIATYLGIQPESLCRIRKAL